MEEERKPEDWRGTVLERVLSSLCSYHRLLLYHMLQDMRKDYGVALALRDGHRRMAKIEPYCCPAEQTSPSDPLPCTLSSCAAGCLPACGFRKCAFSPTCIGMNSVGSLTCQNLALSCVGKVVCPSSAICCDHCKILVCQHQRSNENVCIAHAANVLGVQISHASVLQSCSACQTCRSPSPPPLSPVPVDIECKTGNKNISCKGQEFMARRKPPPLLPHRTEREDEDKALQSDARHAGGFPSVLVKDEHSETEEEDKHYCGSFLGGIMDEFTEKLKNIQPTEKELTPQTADPGQHSELCDDAHLTEIITTVLHSSSDKEYDLKELFEQRMATERRSPQTRSRRRQEVLAALSLSPDLPASRRQSLQIKRDLARLDPSACRRKLEMDKRKCPKNVQSHLPSMLSVKELSGISETESIKQLSDGQSGGLQRLTPETQNHQEEQEKQPADPTEIPFCNEVDLQQTDLSHSKALTKFQQDRSKMLQSDKVGRSRRNIVPPQRFSSYVTEPRKMYYAACFSESVFVKHPLDVNTTSEHDSAEMIHTAAKTDTKYLIKTEAQARVRHHPSSRGMNTLTVLPRKVRTCEDNSGDDNASPTKRLRLSGVESLMKSQSPELILGQSADTHSLKDSKELTYVSPIKLMLVSLVKGEDGVKYTLRAADSGSNPQGEMFDPCGEASWASSSINEQTQDEDFVQNVTFLGSNMKPPQVISADEVDLINLTALPAVQEATPVKRRPGRPKKLGPQIEKLVKRPIGRPPKAKAGDIKSLNGTDVNQRASEKISKDGSKNLKITIMYGRSRKARRVVSEDLERLSTNPHSYEVPSSSYETRNTNSSGGSEVHLAKSQLEDLHFVMPVEDRKGFIHASSNIKCQKQSDSAVTRKPGRPPKVKISGISVTVTTVSPRQRKIHMKKDMKESPLQHRALVMEFEPSKEQKTISQHTNGVLNDTVGTMEEGTEPVRHSVRERKPSIHLLHSVATARSFSRSNALVCRSHKLLMCGATTETNPQTQHGPEVAANNTLSKKTSHKVSHMKNAVRFSGVSVDSIFASDESFKWWSTTASPETLNKELARRIRLMSDTWVSEVLEAKKSEEVKMKQKPKVTGSVEKSSAVKMLFERNYSMEKLCSWFMQTTETQSLAIVKKASARNPYEVFHYSPIRPTCRENVCPSPQAERLRKHVKKFAKVVPKSPTMHRQAQATVYKVRRSFAKRFLFNTSKVNSRHADTQKTHKSCGSWGVYRTALLRARSKFTINAKKTSTTKTDHKIHRSHLGTRVDSTGLSKELLPSVNKVQEAADISESKLLKINASEQTVGITDIFKEERISSKAWSPETLKECRVFLKKINSPSAASVTSEEYNFCTVKFNISPAGCDVPMKQEEQKSSGTTKLQKTFCSPRKFHSSTTAQSKSGAKRRSSRAKESSPAKITRQLRSSRGVLAARWCDFVLGPST